MAAQRKKLLLVELNEITWTLIDPWIAAGKLPTFAWLKQNGASATPAANEAPPHLDPWITWTTLHTGRTQDEHNVHFLQQPPETIHAKRSWEICQQAGLKVGVYGSVCSWPPNAGNAFHVPDTFAQDTATHPSSLEPIQKLNLTYTRSVRLPSDNDGIGFKLKLGASLFGLGLSAATALRIARQLAAERTSPVRWKRVALQPFVNFDFFRRLYQRHRPDFATFHSNHVAHYMHTYWKAMQPELFPQETTEEEKRVYGNAVEYGYRTADELLKNILTLLDGNTVLMIASSLGQQPFISSLRKGKSINQLKNLEGLLPILSLDGRARILPAMSDQFNIYPSGADALQQATTALRDAYIDSPQFPMFVVKELDGSLTATLKRYDETSDDSKAVFPHNGKSFRYGDLVHSTGMIKSGFHHPDGTLILYGAGIRKGVRLGQCTNLDLLPTMLDILGVDPPAGLKGRILSEALQERPVLV